MKKSITKIIKGYKVVFTPEEEGGYSIAVPDLPGCFSCGDDLAHGIAMITEAMELYLETSQELGWPVAQPKYKVEVA